MATGACVGGAISDKGETIRGDDSGLGCRYNLQIGRKPGRVVRAEGRRSTSTSEVSTPGTCNHARQEGDTTLRGLNEHVHDKQSTNKDGEDE